MRILQILLLLVFAIGAQVIHHLSYNRFSHYAPEDWVTYANADYITSIDMGQDEIYLATRGGGIWRYNLYDQKWLPPFTVSTGLRSNRIHRIVYDRQSNQLYAYSEAGVDVYNAGFGYWTPATAGEEPPPQHPLSDGGISDPYARPEISVLNNFFVKGGYTLFPDGTLSDNNHYQFRITDLLVDFQRTLWIGTDGAGIGRANMVTGDLRFERHGPAGNQLRALYRPRPHILWLAGIGGDDRKAAIARYNIRRDRWAYYYSGINLNIPSSRIFAMDGNDRFIFFGSDRGLFTYDVHNKSWLRLNKAPLNDDAVLDLLAVKEGVYIASANGLFFRKNGSRKARIIGRKQLFQRPVNKLSMEKETLYIATDQGVYYYRQKEDSLYFINDATAALPQHFITAITIRSDSVWFAGRFGIGLYAVKTHSRKSFLFSEMNFYPRVNDLLLLDDNIWMATDRGLLKYDTYRDYWYLYTTEDGLPDNRIYQLLADEDYLWLATGHGLVHFKWYDENREE